MPGILAARKGIEPCVTATNKYACNPSPTTVHSRDHAPTRRYLAIQPGLIWKHYYCKGTSSWYLAIDLRPSVLAGAGFIGWHDWLAGNAIGLAIHQTSFSLFCRSLFFEPLKRCTVFLLGSFLIKADCHFYCRWSRVRLVKSADNKLSGPLRSMKFPNLKFIQFIKYKQSIKHFENQITYGRKNFLLIIIHMNVDQEFSNPKDLYVKKKLRKISR